MSHNKGGCARCCRLGDLIHTGEKAGVCERTWALRGGGGGPGVPECTGGGCEGTGGVGTMGGGVWEGCMPPCTANNAMSCADWSPEHVRSSSGQSSHASGGKRIQQEKILAY